MVQGLAFPLSPPAAAQWSIMGHVSGKVGVAMRRGLRAALLVLLIVAGASLHAQQQAAAGAGLPGGQEPYLLQMTTREVLVDVLATDRRGKPIRDLTQQEFEVAEVLGKKKRTQVAMASFRPVDAGVELAPPAPQSGGFRVSVGGDCAARATFHYEISFHPDEEGWQSGYHTLEMRTTRPGVKLGYRTRYYVGERTSPHRLPSTAESAAALKQAACYHADVPPSIGLTARPVSTGLRDVRRLFVTVDADSLTFISVSADNRRVQLDYGACTFDGQGRPLRYFSSAADRLLTSQEYAQAVVHGFPNLLEFPRSDDAAVMRVVVRDRATGNVGKIELALAAAAEPVQQASTMDEASAERMGLGQMDMQALSPGYIRPPMGPIGSFGSIVPRPNTFCGDVYDLPRNTNNIPNFWNLSSIGSLHTTSLDVPHQYFMNTGGIPGITTSTAWLGLDYHAVFWVKTPGVYVFRLLVDDGAILYIDDEKVIDLNGVNSGRMEGGEINLEAGMHTIHVPYIQGPPTDVGLVLAVKPPGERSFEIFDLRNYAAPADEMKTASSP